MNLGLHIIKYPTGTYGYVGRCPVELGEPVPATKADVMGGRSYWGKNGELLTIKWPVFATRQEAIDHAASVGITIESAK